VPPPPNVEEIVANELTNRGQNFDRLRETLL